MAVSHCYKCGGIVSDNASYCPNCGTAMRFGETNCSSCQSTGLPSTKSNDCGSTIAGSLLIVLALYAMIILVLIIYGIWLYDTYIS